MKIKFLLTVFALVLITSNAYASFPVKRILTVETAQTMSVDNDVEVKEMLSPAAFKAGKQMSTALLLFFFLGFVAAHRWYLDSPVGWNILYILTLGGLGVWAIIDLIDIITEKFPSM